MAGKQIIHKPTFGEYINLYFKQNSEVTNGIHRGLVDIKAGRVRPWLEIKRELNL